MSQLAMSFFTTALRIMIVSALILTLPLTIVTSTETQMERSGILKHIFDDALLKLARLLAGKLMTLLDPTEQRMERSVSALLIEVKQ
jgi:hypothetical protein